MESSEDEHREAILHDDGKPTPSDASPIVQTPRKNFEYSKDEPRDAIIHDAGNPTPSVLTAIVCTLTQIPSEGKKILGSPYDTTLASRR
jgi:hypothetical protein